MSGVGRNASGSTAAPWNLFRDAPGASGGDVVKSKVVIVDDVQESLTTTSAFLTDEGYEVTPASSSEQALKLIEGRRPNVVLFRILSPANVVIDFVRRLALNREARMVPVVMVTALNEYQIGSFLNGVPGVRRILYEPCPPDALRESMALALRSDAG
jgi:CheY-like chemotaxis protein